VSAPLHHSAAAKINLALVVGPRRRDGLHELASVMQRIDLCDDLILEPADTLEVTGFDDDTLVTAALERLAAAAGVPAGWRACLTKRIPVAAGLGGGSADAAAALTLANRTLAKPLDPGRLLELAKGLGSDVPFFVEPGAKLVEGVGERLRLLQLPQEYWVLVALPAGSAKTSTAEVYRRFDARGGGPGFPERRARLLEAVASCQRPEDLAALPPNDLAPAGATSSLPEALAAAGAFRADVSGAGPAVYGLFRERERARAAEASLPAGTRAWVVAPVW
jgi:4-diphosphocytidyl-2-C-methyl-D-erythritol kinase